MKSIVIFIINVVLWSIPAYSINPSEQDANILIQELYEEIKELKQYYATQKNTLEEEKIALKSELYTSEISTDKKVALLIRQQQIAERLEVLAEGEQIDIRKLRYIKG